MPTETRDLPTPSAIPSVTPETLSEYASRADLGELDDRTALKIKLCEARIEAHFLPMIAALEGKINTLGQRYQATLRELRERLTGIRFDDFLKVVIGILGTLVVREFAEKGRGVPILTWVGLLLLVVSMVFLIVRYVQPSRRSREIEQELKETRSRNNP